METELRLYKKCTLRYKKFILRMMIGNKLSNDRITIFGAWTGRFGGYFNIQL
jgi:hypothetical protein